MGTKAAVEKFGDLSVAGPGRDFKWAKFAVAGSVARAAGVIPPLTLGKRALAVGDIFGMNFCREFDSEEATAIARFGLAGGPVNAGAGRTLTLSAEPWLAGVII